MIRHTEGHRGIKLLKDDPKVNLYKFHSFCEGCRGLVSRVDSWVDILYRKPFFEPLDQILKNCQISPFSEKFDQKWLVSRVEAWRRTDWWLAWDNHGAVDWGRWGGGRHRPGPSSILRKVITQPMLKYWATEQIVTTAHHKQTTATIWLEFSSNQKIEIENRKIEINASGKLLIGPTFYLFQSLF